MLVECGKSNQVHLTKINKYYIFLLNRAPVSQGGGDGHGPGGRPCTSVQVTVRTECALVFPALQLLLLNITNSPNSPK